MEKLKTKRIAKLKKGKNDKITFPSECFKVVSKNLKLTDLDNEIQ